MAIVTALPARSADDTSSVPSRAAADRSAYVAPISNKELYSADEGSYFMGLTPTPGTGVIGAASMTAFVTTTPIMVVYNGDTTKRLYPQFLNLYETVVSTSGARVQFTFYTDSANRYVSGGTALTISSTNSGGAANSTTAIHVGAVTASAASAQVLIDHVVFRGTIDVVEDCYEFVFGGVGGGNASASRVTTVQDFSRTLPPVCIMPGHSLCIYQWAASQANAPTYEYRFGFMLR